MENHAFTLTDRKGKSHRYEVRLHNPGPGFLILRRLSGLGLEPLAELLEGALPTLLPLLDAQDFSQADLSVFGDAIELGNAAHRFIEAFQQIDPLLIRYILENTDRDGQPLIDTPDAEVNPTFDAAYRGNYGEMFQACWRVVVLNGFFPDSVTSLVDAIGRSAGKALESNAFSSGQASMQTGGTGVLQPVSA